MSLAIEKKEEAFHDEWAKSTDLSQIEVEALFESASAPENRHILQWMGDIHGLKLLELGCGLGEASVYFALKGAHVTASDLSRGMLDVTLKLAQARGVTIQTQVSSATDLSAFPDSEFDIVYAANLLHHVNIEACLQEIHRKLKPGGRAYFWDPFLYNPAIQIYRRMATKVRTEDEHPLRFEDLKTVKNQFGQVEIRFFWLTALAIFFKYFLWDRIHPNQARYWKKVIEDSEKIGSWLQVLHRIDAFLFKWIPPLKYIAWNVTIEAKKK